MSDYISRADAMAEFREWVKRANENGETPTWNDAVSLIGSLPSAEAEQVTSKLNNTCDSLLTDDSAECKEQKSKLESAEAEPKWNCTANFVVEQLDRLRNMTDEERLNFFINFFSPSADAEFADLPDIPRAYYERIVGNMAHEINMLKEQLESGREFYNDAVKANIRILIENEKLKEQIESAEAVQGWEIGKPTEQGKYMVTLDSFRHKRIDLFYYGKPMMPNRKVRGKCWYRSDDEWGDVVYDDTDILAWQPLPKPYKGGDDE